MGTFALPWSRQKLISALMTAAATSRRWPSEWQASLAGSVAASCVCPSPGREVLIGRARAAVRVQGSFQL